MCTESPWSPWSGSNSWTSSMSSTSSLEWTGAVVQHYIPSAFAYTGTQMRRTPPVVLLFCLWMVCVDSATLRSTTTLRKNISWISTIGIVQVSCSTGKPLQSLKGGEQILLQVGLIYPSHLIDRSVLFFQNSVNINFKRRFWDALMSNWWCLYPPAVSRLDSPGSPLSFGGRKTWINITCFGAAKWNCICCLSACTKDECIGELSIINQKASIPISWISLLKAGVDLLISIQRLGLIYLTKYHSAMTASISSKKDLLAVRPACGGIAYGSLSMLSQIIFIIMIFNSVDNVVTQNIALFIVNRLLGSEWAVPKFPKWSSLLDFFTIAGDLLLESSVPEVLFTIERDFTIDGFTYAGSLLYPELSRLIRTYGNISRISEDIFWIRSITF